MQKKKVIRETIEAIVIALILALIIRSFVIQAFKIPSSSMEPTLLIGDHLLVNKFIYGVSLPFTEHKVFPLKKPKSGDVFVFEFPGNPEYCKSFSSTIRKRFQNTVEKGSAWQLITDDCKALENNRGVNVDPYVYPRGPEPRDNFGPYTVPKDSVFAMGDNRDRSFDSRYWGSVNLNEIKGKAFIIYWSWDSDEHWVRWRRFANIIR